MGLLNRRTLVVALLVLAAMGCGGPAERTVTETATGATPERIIAVSPSVVEMLFLLGVGDRVVGVGDFARWPPEASRLPRIGGLLDARLERIVTLDPDLAVLLPSEADLATQLAALGVEVLTVPSETLADVEAAMRSIAQRTGTTGTSETALATWRRELAPAPVDGAPKVLLSLAREGGRFSQILAAGPDTFLDELLERMGAGNVFADAPLRYPQIGPEQVVKRRPRIVLELQPEPPSEEQRARLKEEWRDLLGRERVCVEVIAGDHVLLPGPRLPRLYREMREAIAGCLGAPADPVEG